MLDNTLRPMQLFLDRKSFDNIFNIKKKTRHVLMEPFVLSFFLKAILELHLHMAYRVWTVIYRNKFHVTQRACDKYSSFQLTLRTIAQTTKLRQKTWNIFMKVTFFHFIPSAIVEVC